MNNSNTKTKQLTLGLVQNTDENLFSPWMLAAYKNLESESIKLVIVGGGSLYKTQSEKLNCKNVSFLSLPDSNEELLRLMSSFDIFIHGSINGESDMKYIEMAQELGIPIVSHYAQGNNSHAAVIGESGVLHGDFNSYIFEVWNLMTHELYREWRGKRGKEIIKAKKGTSHSSEDEWLMDWLDD